MRRLKMTDSIGTVHDALDYSWGAVEFEGDAVLKAILDEPRKRWVLATSKRNEAQRAEKQAAGGHARSLHRLGQTMGSFSKVEEGHMATDEGSKWTRLIIAPSQIVRAAQAARKLKLDDIVEFVTTNPLPTILKSPAKKLQTIWTRVTGIEKTLTAARKTGAASVTELNAAKQDVVDALAKLEGELMRRHGSDREEIESYFLDLSAAPADEEQKKDDPNPPADGQAKTEAAGDAEGKKSGKGKKGGKGKSSESKDSKDTKDAGKDAAPPPAPAKKEEEPPPPAA